MKPFYIFLSIINVFVICAFLMVGFNLEQFQENEPVAIKAYAHDPASTLILVSSVRPEPRPEPSEKNEELVCLTHLIYLEARGEKEKGQKWVAQVAENRADDHRWPNSICDVAYQAYQFSYTLDRPYIDLSDSIERKAYMKAEKIAKNILQNDTKVTDAVYFYNPKKSNPDWANMVVRIAQVGNHIFLK